MAGINDSKAFIWVVTDEVEKVFFFRFVLIDNGN
jgi:hypothetical protein